MLFKFIPFCMRIGHFVSSHLSLRFAFQLYITSIKFRMQENRCWIIWNTITFKCYEPLKIHPLLSFLFQPTTLNFTSTEPASYSIGLHNGAPRNTFHSGYFNSSGICNNSGQKVLERFQSTYGGNYILETSSVFLFNWKCWCWSFLSTGLKRKCLVLRTPQRVYLWSSLLMPFLYVFFL